MGKVKDFVVDQEQEEIPDPDELEYEKITIFYRAKSQEFNYEILTYNDNLLNIINTLNNIEQEEHHIDVITARDEVMIQAIRQLKLKLEEI